MSALTIDREAVSKPAAGEILLPAGYGTEILRVEVGSTLHGTGLGVAHEDHDEMGVFVETKHSTIGLAKKDHYVTRTAEKDQRSQPGDTDLVVYSLRKWARLALTGNPSVILLLHAPLDKVVKLTELGSELRSHREWFASKRAGHAFLGYMEQQRQRMVGQRGRAGRVRVLGDCEACSGIGICGGPGGYYDTLGKGKPCPDCNGCGKRVDWKYAMHMLRLGYQGVEFLTTGRLELPIPGEMGDWLREVRQGNIEFAEIIKVAESQEETVKRLLDGASSLRDFPDVERAENWVINAHLRTWGVS